MESLPFAPAPASDSLTFRSVKRRKIYRRREDSPTAASSPAAAAPVAAPTDSSSLLDSPSAHAAEALSAGPSRAANIDADADADTDSAPPAALTNTIAPPVRRHKLASKLRRRPGIEFCATHTGVSAAAAATATAVSSDSTALEAPRVDTAADVAARRFAPQTGVAADTHGAHM